MVVTQSVWRQKAILTYRFSACWLREEENAETEHEREEENDETENENIFYSRSY